MRELWRESWQTLAGGFVAFLFSIPLWVVFSNALGGFWNTFLIVGSAFMGIIVWITVMYVWQSRGFIRRQITARRQRERMRREEFTE